MFLVVKLFNGWLFEHLNGTEEWVPCLLRIESVTALFISCGPLMYVCQTHLKRGRRNVFHYYHCQFSHWFGLTWCMASISSMWPLFGLMFEWWIQGVVNKPFSWWTPHWPYSMFIIYVCFAIHHVSIVRLNYIVCCNFALANIFIIIFGSIIASLTSWLWLWPLKISPIWSSQHKLRWDYSLIWLHWFKRNAYVNVVWEDEEVDPALEQDA